MFGLRIKLTIILLLALVFGAVQCATACTVASCKAENTPPCHKHRPTVSQHSCEQVFVRPAMSGHSDHLDGVFELGIFAAAPHVPRPTIAQLRITNSPPGWTSSSPEVLRI
jgi:hypothetical protein